MTFACRQISTHINIVVAITLAKSAKIIIFTIAVAVDVQVTKLGNRRRRGLGCNHYLGNIGSIAAVVVELIDVRSSLGTAVAGTGIRQAPGIARVLAVGFGGIRVGPIVVPVASVVPPAAVLAAQIDDAIVSETVHTVIEHELVGNVRAGDAGSVLGSSRILVTLGSVQKEGIYNIRTAGAEIRISNSGLVAGILAVRLGRVSITGIEARDTNKMVRNTVKLSNLQLPSHHHHDKISTKNSKSNFILHLHPIVIPITIVEPPRAGSAASVLVIVVGRTSCSFCDHELIGDVGAGNASYVSSSAATNRSASSAASGSATTTEIIGDGTASRG